MAKCAAIADQPDRTVQPTTSDPSDGHVDLLIIEGQSALDDNNSIASASLLQLDVSRDDDPPITALVCRAPDMFDDCY